MTEEELATMETAHYRRELEGCEVFFCDACADETDAAWPCEVARLVAEVRRLRMIVASQTQKLAHLRRQLDRT